VDVTIEYDGRTFLAPALTETIFDHEVIRIVIKLSISREALLDKW
jgi:hypothetical protein